MPKKLESIEELVDMANQAETKLAEPNVTKLARASIVMGHYAFEFCFGYFLFHRIHNDNKWQGGYRISEHFSSTQARASGMV